MTLIKEPQYPSPSYNLIQITKPAYRGINLNTPPNALDINETPNMMNMMYRNGVLDKRYGQQIEHEYDDIIYNLTSYYEQLIVHSGDKLYKNHELIANGLSQTGGRFFSFNRFLYYVCGGKYYQYDGIEFKEVQPYVPDVVINRKPDGSISGDTIEDYNMIGSAFKITFDGDGTSTVYLLPDNCKPLDNTNAKITVDNVVLTGGYTVDAVNAKITFDTPLNEGTNNVVIEVNKVNSNLKNDILNCKYSVSYGGGNNSRIFFAGNGKSILYYSDVYDATYFPDSQYMTIGNTESDITGFGEQYDVLIVFKQKEIFKIEYYQDSQKIGRFTSAIVNAKIGCDAPYTIQLINNQLVWLSSNKGVMVLVSTVIEDERNVRPISYNIESTSGVLGELSIITDEESNFLTTEDDDILVTGSTYFSFDYDSKYWLCVNSKVYCWDYLIAPYFNSGKILEDSSRCAWFIFDNIDINVAIENNRELYCAQNNKICKLNNNYHDFGKPIIAVYQTPLLEFIRGNNSAFDFLKTIRKIEIQTQSGKGTIDITYLTDEYSIDENESIEILDRAHTNRRKCSIKKVQMFGVKFKNDRLHESMPIAKMSFEYSNIKMVK